MDDERSSNVAGAEPGPDASPAPEPRETSGREAGLAAKSLSQRDTYNDPAPARDEARCCRRELKAGGGLCVRRESCRCRWRLSRPSLTPDEASGIAPTREGFAPGGPRRRCAREMVSDDWNAWRTGGSAPLATVVSLPTAREARPGAQRRDTPAPEPFVFSETRLCIGYRARIGSPGLTRC